MSTVLGLLAQGSSVDDVLSDYPTLTPADVRACLAYAAWAVDVHELPLRLPA